MQRYEAASYNPRARSAISKPFALHNPPLGKKKKKRGKKRREKPRPKRSSIEAYRHFPRKGKGREKEGKRAGAISNRTSLAANGEEKRGKGKERVAMRVSLLAAPLENQRMRSTP